MNWALAIIGIVAIQRLGELPFAEFNTRRLMARGAVEIGRAHYPVIVVLHAAWLIAIFLALPSPPVIYAVPLAIYTVLQVLRTWTLWSLGRYWTTRIITVPDAPLVRRGPYRFMRHPNYAIVEAEMILLPLVFGEWLVGIVFLVLNTLVLGFRIREEDRALEARRTIGAQ